MTSKFIISNQREVQRAVHGLQLTIRRVRRLCEHRVVLTTKGDWRRICDNCGLEELAPPYHHLGNGGVTEVDEAYYKQAKV